MSITAIWDVASVGIWLVLAVGGLTWVFSRLNPLFSILVDLAAPATVLLLAAAIYATPQMRETFWLAYDPTQSSDSSSISDVFALIHALLFTNFWTTASILVLTIALGIWGPARFYQFPEIIRAFRQANAHETAVALLNILSTSKAHPAVPGWSICSMREPCAGDQRRAGGDIGWLGRDR